MPPHLPTGSEKIKNASAQSRTPCRADTLVRPAYSCFHSRVERCRLRQVSISLTTFGGQECPPYILTLLRSCKNKSRQLRCPGGPHNAVFVVWGISGFH